MLRSFARLLHSYGGLLDVLELPSVLWELHLNIALIRRPYLHYCVVLLFLQIRLCVSEPNRVALLLSLFVLSFSGLLLRSISLLLVLTDHDLLRLPVVDLLDALLRFLLLPCTFDLLLQICLVPTLVLHLLLIILDSFPVL